MWRLLLTRRSLLAPLVYWLLNRRSGPARRWALVAMAVVVLVPVLVLVLAAVALGLAVFALMSLLAVTSGLARWPAQALRRWFVDDGRRNVRVVQRPNPHL